MLKKLLLTFSLIFFTTNIYANENPQVRISTNFGDIDIELNQKKAPKSVANFLKYANEGYYTGTIFHRVIKSFMIQGGGFTPELQRKETSSPIENEAFNGLKNDKGTIAMARTNDPHSATSQFFINTKDNAFLNHTNKTPRGWGYTVFGKVIKGMDVVDKIENSKTGAKGVFGQDVPKQTVVINIVTIIKK